MKKFILLLFAVLFYEGMTYSQSCLPEGVTFTTQTQVDNFPVSYPGCSIIEGSVTIGSLQGSDISNLNGLSSLTSVGGNLSLVVNPGLSSLSGLSNLTTLEGDLYIGGNEAISSLTGLNKLKSIGGGLYIEVSGSLGSLNGLDSLISIGGDLALAYNPVLASLTGLERLASIGGGLYVNYNASLQGFSELENVAAIAGTIEITNNDELESLDGLDNVSTGAITELIITGNPSLSFCEVNSVCVFVNSSGVTIDIQDNATGCNNIAEVKAACEAGSIEDVATKDIFSLYPNPSSGQFTLSFSQSDRAHVRLEVLNQVGQVVETILDESLSQGDQQDTWNAEGLSPGVYFLRISTTDNRQQAIKKMVVVR